MTYMEDIRSNIDQLVSGWTERVEYGVTIQEQREIRVKTVYNPGLIQELRENIGIKRPGIKCERTAPNKPGSRPPGDMAAFHLLDEIEVEAEYLRTRIRHEQGLAPAEQIPRVEDLLAGLVQPLALMQDGHPELLRTAAVNSTGWVRQARHLLGHDVPRKTLAQTVCGKCGGALAVAADASTSVECIGDSLAGPCGTTYPQSQWLALARHENFGGGVGHEAAEHAQP